MLRSPPSDRAVAASPPSFVKALPVTQGSPLASLPPEWETMATSEPAKFCQMVASLLPAAA